MCNKLSKKWQLVWRRKSLINIKPTLLKSFNLFMFLLSGSWNYLQCITMSHQDHNSKKKNPLNNSSIDLRTDKVVPLPTVKVLHVHNMLNADKENIQYAPMEKNLARSLRPALRTVNQTVSKTFFQKKCK